MHFKLYLQVCAALKGMTFSAFFCVNFNYVGLKSTTDLKYGKANGRFQGLISYLQHPPELKSSVTCTKGS